MGKIQCVSLKSDIEILDIINNGDEEQKSFFEKIFYEYNSLRNQTKSKKESKQVNSEVYIYTAISLRLSRFKKWYKMIYSNSTKLLKTLESEDFYNNYIIDKITKRNRTQKNIKLRKYTSPNISFSVSDIDIDQEVFKNIEDGLNKFYTNHKEKFLERVSKGPPDSFRIFSYFLILDIKIKSDNLLNNLIAYNINDEIDIQIKKDLTRTSDLTFNSENQLSLYRILKAIAILDKELSYCQGMNFIAGFVLYLTDFNEIDTLYLLISLFSNTFSNKYNIRGFFISGFPLLRYYLFVFDYYFDKKIPNLKKHFDKLEITKDIWVGKWFQTLFTINMPLKAVTRIWDSIIVNGSEFIINIALSILKIIENDLLKMNELMEIVNYFKIITKGKNDTNSNFIINIDDVIKKAKKINFDKEVIHNLKKQFENENDILLSETHKSYDLEENILTCFNTCNMEDSLCNIIQEINSISTPNVSRFISPKCSNIVDEENSICCEDDDGENIQNKVHTHTTRSFIGKAGIGKIKRSINQIHK